MTSRFNRHALRFAATALLAATGACLAGNAAAQAFGIDAAGKLYHVDKGWSAGFNYLCLNGACYTGTREQRRRRAHCPRTIRRPFSSTFL